MNLFRRLLGERCADCLDWIDYRPDASFWPLFAVPPMLSVAWAYGGWIGLGIVFTFALGVMLAVAFVASVGVLAWIVGRAALDFTVQTKATYGLVVRRRRVGAGSVPA